MMHRAKGFKRVTHCGRKMNLSLKPLKWRRALLSEENANDMSIPYCKVCFNLKDA